MPVDATADGPNEDAKQTLFACMPIWAVMMPKFHPKRCGHCGGCAAVCPRNAITVLERQRHVDMGLCDGCGVCAVVCPARALVKA